MIYNGIILFSKINIVKYYSAGFSSADAAGASSTGADAAGASFSAAATGAAVSSVFFLEERRVLVAFLAAFSFSIFSL